MNLDASKTYGLLRRTFAACALGALLLAAGATARAQCPAETLTAGLAGPLDITHTPLGNLLVAETGTPAPNTGRVSIVDRAGNRRTLLEGLPSGFNAIGDLSGTNGLLLRGRTLYVVNGEGDSTLAGPAPGTEVPNPNPSSPIFSSILAVHFSANVERTTTGFALTPADHLALKQGQTLTLGAGGDQIMIRLVADFPDFTPAPLPFFAPNVRHSNPYHLVAIGDQLYVTDGGQNLVWRVDIETGAFAPLAVFPPIPNPAPFGPPVIEAVPTGIAISGDQLLVTLFRGFPFPPGTSEVRTVNPQTGAHAALITGLTSAIGVLPVRDGGAASLLTLELSTNFLMGQPGRLRRYATTGGAPTDLATCLISPSSMAYDQKTGTLYVTEVFTGRIVTLSIGAGAGKSSAAPGKAGNF